MASPLVMGDDQSHSPFEASVAGFLTLAAGKVVSGTSNPASDSGFHCPCIATDYAQGGVYEAGRWRIGPDSKLGLQGTVGLPLRGISITGQVVDRGARNGRADLEWLYGSVDVSSALTLQVGRKRLPILAESEAQDVGYALPWVHLPPQLYGWEIVNYNGANLRYRGSVGAAAASVNIFGGSETVKDSPFEQVYLGRASHSDVRWPRITGIEANLNWGALEWRAVFISSQTQYRYLSSGDTDYSAPTRQRIWGLSATYDQEEWVGRAELLYIDRRADYGSDQGQLLAVGHHFGLWLPMLSFSRYRQSTLAIDNPPEGHDMVSLLLRRELGASAALKLQFDVWRDHSGAGFAYPHGDRKLITIAYVRVF